MKYFKHPTAEVQAEAIGEGTRIWQHSIVLKDAKIGKECNINSHCFIENDVIIGNNVTLKCGVYAWDGIRLEDNVFIGPNVTFNNDLRPRSKQRPAAFQKTIVKKGASIGGGAVLLGGITIGEYAMIGAGSVVTKDVPPHTLWYGNPARSKESVCDCGNKISTKQICIKCNKGFKQLSEKKLRVRNKS